MTLTELPGRHAEERPKSKPEATISPSIINIFMAAAGMTEEDRRVAEQRVRRILRNATPVEPDRVPKNMKKPTGVEVTYRAHWMRPDVVYRLCTTPDGKRHYDTVIRYDSDGRPGFTK